MISRGLNEAFGTSLRSFISRSTNNRFKAFSVGAIVATMLQSSTATCMIVSSFAARNIITVSAAVTLMLGADVGTTFAAQVMALDLSWLSPVLIISGYFLSKILHRSIYKPVGISVVGMGLALLSLKLIAAAVEPLKHSEALHVLINPLVEQPAMAVIFSALLTWMVHSSLGMVLLYMGFVASGTIPLELGLYLVLGANAGSAIGPVIMTLKEQPAGRRVPLGNLLIRSIGVVAIFPFMSMFVIPFIQQIHPNPARVVVNFHTAFNLVLGLSFLPFINVLTKMSEIVLPDMPRYEDKSLPRYLDPNAITSPAAAMAGAVRETLRICDIIQDVFAATLIAIKHNNQYAVREIHEKELVVDSLYKSIKMYLSRLPLKSLSREDQRRYMQILVFATNLEHVGDIIDKNLMYVADKKIRDKKSFSEEGLKEIENIHAEVTKNIQLAQTVFMTGDVEMAKQLNATKGVLREEEMKGFEAHLRRLNEGVAETIATTSLHVDVLRDLRRINSYIALIAYSIIKDAEERKSDAAAA